MSENLTKEALAAMLNGRQYGKEISKLESARAKSAGLVVVFGYSDDNVEFRGAIDDEIGAYNGTTLRITPLGLLPEWDVDDMSDEQDAEAYFLKKHAGYQEIEACWASEGDYSWTFKTEIPHAPFEVLEDEGPFCRGIVFALADVRA
jgi:hypothetical protein